MNFLTFSRLLLGLLLVGYSPSALGMVDIDDLDDITLFPFQKAYESDEPELLKSFLQRTQADQLDAQQPLEEQQQAQPQQALRTSPINGQPVDPCFTFHDHDITQEASSPSDSGISDAGSSTTSDTSDISSAGESIDLEAIFDEYDALEHMLVPQLMPVAPVALPEPMPVAQTETQAQQTQDQLLLALALTDPAVLQQLIAQQQQQQINIPQVQQPVALQQQPMNASQTQQPVAPQQRMAVGQEQKDVMMATSCSICWTPLTLPRSYFTNAAAHGIKITCQNKNCSHPQRQQKPSRKRKTSHQEEEFEEEGDDEPVSKSKNAQAKPRIGGKFIKTISSKKSKKSRKKLVTITCHNDKKRCGATLKIPADLLAQTLERIKQDNPPRTQKQLECMDFGYECSLHLRCKTCGSTYVIPKKYTEEFATHQERERFTCASIEWRNMSNVEKKQLKRCPLMQEISEEEPTPKKKKTKVKRKR